MRELVSKFDHVVPGHRRRFATVPMPASWPAKCGSALVLTRKDQNRVVRFQDLVASLAGSPVQLLGAVVNEF